MIEEIKISSTQEGHFEICMKYDGKYFICGITDYINIYDPDLDRIIKRFIDNIVNDTFGK